MERILQFADSKTTEKLWIFFSENVRKYVNNAAFSNIYNLFSERVNTIFFLQCFLCIVKPIDVTISLRPGSDHFLNTQLFRLGCKRL